MNRRAFFKMLVLGGAGALLAKFVKPKPEIQFPWMTGIFAWDNQNMLEVDYKTLLLRPNYWFKFYVEEQLHQHNRERIEQIAAIRRIRRS